MNSQNVYVNDSARFNASQNSPPKHGTADENQYKNFSEESEYVKIDVIGSQNKKIEQEDSILQKRTQPQGIYFLFALSILIAIAASAVACLALVKISTLSIPSTDFKLVEGIKQTNDLSKSRISDNERSIIALNNNTNEKIEKIHEDITTLNNSTKKEIERIDKNASEIRDNATVLRQDIKILQRNINDANIEIAQIRTILNRSYVMLEDEWIGLFNGFQYKLSNESLSWNESRKICEAWGSDLIVHGVRDAGTRNTLHRGLSLGWRSYFIGASDHDDDGHFTWVNGDSLPIGDSLWVSGQPNGDGNCCRADFNRPVQAIWDGPCSSSNFAVCEKTF